MTVPRFYVPDRLAPGVSGTFSDAQARQLRTVLRMASGGLVVLFDGSGAEATASVEIGGRDRATFTVQTVEHPRREPPVSLTVGLALLRGERFDVAVQKLTEIGVARLVPLAAERCVVSFDVAREWPRKAERYERIMREAAEQSERVRLMEIEPPVSPAVFLSRQPTIVLAEREDALSIAGLPLATEMALAVGPEGGWSQRELAALGTAEVTAASLGSLIYRAETAAIVAAGVIAQRAWVEF